MAVKVGDTFRSVYQDSNPEWRVKAKAGLSVWYAKVIDGEHQGTVRPFTTDEVERAMQWQKAVKSIMDDHETYIANLPIGAVVHYHNGFSQFIRCVRVDGPDRERLKPIALVGAWREHDLPRLNLDGTVRLGYQAEHIVGGKGFEPNFSSIWESRDAKGKAWMVRGVPGGFDPTTAEPIDLTPPAPDEHARLVAGYVRRFRAIADLLEDAGQDPSAMRARLDAIAKEAAQPVGPVSG